MARRSGLVATLAQIEREAQRARVAQLRAQAAAQRDYHRAQVAYQRAAVLEEKEQLRLYADSRLAEVAAMNDDLAARDAALAGLLAATLDVDDTLDFDRLKTVPELPPFQPGALATPEPQPDWRAYAPPEPGGLGKMFGKQKHLDAVEAGKQRYAYEVAQYTAREQARVAALEAARQEHEKRLRVMEEDAARQHAEIDAFRGEYEAGDPAAVRSYFELVLSASAYPDGFPQKFKLAFVPESRQLVVEYDLPPIAVVPSVKAFKYVKASDAVTQTARPVSSVKSLYASVLAQVTIRTLHELFEADGGRQVDTVVFNGMVDAVDAATGQHVRPCLVTVRTTRDVFDTLDLARVDPFACLRHLGAGVSKKPEELAPVRPVLEFDMVDPRFIDSADVLGTLDQRPNLMELTPGEFEALIQNLFSSMGLDTKQTRASRDGGVDCVAYDPRPIFGGKVVIQAKRCRHTVGVSAVRDLFGTLQNEGASKGILVTTSGYGQASYEFAKNKPIELIDAANLLYLLSQHTGVEAKIVPPDGWRDPIADVAEDEPARS
jgi:restriction system protein